MKITIAIVTKNRPHHLKSCLKSISSQTSLPHQILLIDNSRQQSAHSTCKLFSSLPLKYLPQPKPGVAHSRNLALRTCRTKLLGFVDDDCTLHKNWTKTAQSLKWNQNTAYFIGTNTLANPQSLIAQATYIRQHYWFHQKLSHQHTSPFNLDTKNIIFDLKLIKKHHLKFDPTFTIGPFDSSDTNLGFQIQKKSLTGRFTTKLLVKHAETTQLSHYTNKAYQKGRLAYILHQKWHLEGELIDRNQTNLIGKIKALRHWPHEYHQMTSSCKLPTTPKIIIFNLIKLYDYCFLRGFLSQQSQPS